MLKKLNSILDWCNDHYIFICGSVAIAELLWLVENKLKDND